MQRARRGGFGKFDIILRVDLVERSCLGSSRRRVRHRHLVGEFEHLLDDLGRSRPDLGLGGRLIEACQQRVDVVLAVGCGRRGLGGRRCGLRRRNRRPGRGRFGGGNGRWRDVVHHGRFGCRRRGGGLFRRLAGGGWLRQLAGFSAWLPAGLASSSAMMRRIDARISSIEGSGIFAACVISDSTSSTPSVVRFTPRTTGFAGSGYAGRDFHRTSLTCPQIKRARCIAPLRLPQGDLRGYPARGREMQKTRRESLCCLRKRYVMATIDCKQTRRADAARSRMI